MNIKKFLPWWLKICSKIVLSRLPFDYNIWQKISLFKHGYMEVPNYVYSVFKQHFENTHPPEGFISLELGPGDSLCSGIVSKALGGVESYLVDVSNFARNDIKIYQTMIDYLAEEKKHSLTQISSMEELCDTYSIKYLTEGLQSLKTIPSKSIDMIWSQAVLEHLKKSEFLEIMIELRRIIKDDGICSHKIDLKDHLDTSLNNLRFSEKIWESNLFSQSGFYTNRIRYTAMINLFKKANFDVETVGLNKWNELPINRSSLDKEFQKLSDEELCISGFSVILKPC
ncbi:MAG: methyltransferase domain-containing protein [Crocosphaera sp.]